MLERLTQHLSVAGYLVFNNHGNTLSMRAPGAFLRRHLLGQQVSQLSPWQTKRLLERQALEVVEVAGFGLLVPRLLKLLGPAVYERGERLLGHVRPLRWFCTDLVIVSRRARV